MFSGHVTCVFVVGSVQGGESSLGLSLECRRVSVYGLGVILEGWALAGFGGRGQA
ncbi:hypothetical protein DY000_02030708 [Brassica cretica]|uniref:Uncharacterized protein n=1 Tax=Brassica cretica TaxID=69181 RepID=A0ABQ7DP61_BRACR|nr:hypothetical protein DY000_02030708 [Brassica cretica]